MSRIWCPKCQWIPGPRDQWTCRPGCGHEWHTFDTRGQCPSCLKQWEQTSCFRCNRWSLHERWYHDDGSDEKLSALLGETAPQKAKR